MGDFFYFRLTDTRKYWKKFQSFQKGVQKKVDEKDRERVADEMLEMVQDIYVTARFDKATPRERFLMYKMMLLAYHEHYVS